MSEKNKAQLLSSLAKHINEVTVDGVEFKGNIDLSNADVTLDTANLVIEGAIEGKVLTAGAGGAIVWGDAGTTSLPANVVTTTGGKIDSAVLPTTVVQTVDGVIPSSLLPSYVDDVLEVANTAALPAIGEAGKLYIEMDTGKVKRWSGTVYVEINASAGLADTATKLATARSITSTGDVAFTVDFDGSANVSSAATLAATGVTAGTYKSVSVDAKGRVTAGTNPTTLAGYGITDGSTTMTTFKFTAGSSGNVTFTGSDLSAPPKTLLVSPDKLFVSVNGVQQHNFTVVNSGNVTVPGLLLNDEVVITSFDSLNLTSIPYSAITGAPASSAAQIQSDYAQTNTAALDFIKNKPTLGTAAATDSSAYATASQGTKADTAVQPSSLATVATSGSYTDLTNKPTLGTAAATDSSAYATMVQGFKADSALQPSFALSLATVATSGDYNDLNNKPSLPVLAPVATSGFYSDLVGQPTYATVAATGSYNDLSDKPTLATVATTGSYNDLSDKPTSSSGATTLDGLFDVATDWGSMNMILGTTPTSVSAISVGNAMFGGIEQNTSLGLGALDVIVSGSYNTAIGAMALAQTTTGSWNTAIGVQSLYTNTTGSRNTAAGYKALQNNTTGNDNTASGWLAATKNTTGYNNIAMGMFALGSNITGNNNTAIGTNALFTPSDWSGSLNTAIGFSAGGNSFEGENCTIIGASTSLAGAVTNVTVIGYGAASSGVSNEVTIGNDNVTSTRLKGKVSAKTFFSEVITDVTTFEVDKADVFTRTVSGATTFSVTGTPASGLVCSFVLELTNGGSGAITWWSGVKWAGGVTPTWTTTGVDLIEFYTHDGGTTWRASVLALDSK